MSGPTLNAPSPTPAERAKKIAGMANECCFRSDGYEEAVATLAEVEICVAERFARIRALEECYEIAKDFTGQGAIIASLIKNRLDA